MATFFGYENGSLVRFVNPMIRHPDGTEEKYSDDAVLNEMDVIVECPSDPGFNRGTDDETRERYFQRASRLDRESIPHNGMNVEQHIEVLERQVKSLRIDMKHNNEFRDVVSSPLWKRIIWWFCGFYFRKVGRWCGSQTWRPRWPK